MFLSVSGEHIEVLNFQTLPKSLVVIRHLPLHIRADEWHKQIASKLTLCMRKVAVELHLHMHGATRTFCPMHTVKLCFNESTFIPLNCLHFAFGSLLGSRKMSQQRSWEYTSNAIKDIAFEFGDA